MFSQRDGAAELIADPAIGVSPAPPGLVGLDTWFWVTPGPAVLSSEVLLGGYRYRLAVSPRYPVTATVSWSVTWSLLSAGAWYGPYLVGGEDPAAASLIYAVRQAQTELLSGR